MRDLRTVASAIVGGVQLSRQGLLGKGIKTIKGKEATFKVKAKGVDKDVTLDTEDLKQLDVTSDESVKKLVASKLGVNETDIDLSPIPTETFKTKEKGKRNWKKFGKREVTESEGVRYKINEKSTSKQEDVD